LVAGLAPALIVELGTHFGESYFGFCQTVDELGLVCRCCAVDTWRGDIHSGVYGDTVFAQVESYNDLNYRRFSSLLRTTFDAANAQFDDGTIDLLHIDGAHTYEAARHDFDLWFPKVRPGGVILIHDIAARKKDFGVWRLWDEIKPKFISFEFIHNWGLGVIRKEGGEQKPFLDFLFNSSPSDRAFIATYYADIARMVEMEHELAESARAIDNSFLTVYPHVNGEYTEARTVISQVIPGDWAHYVLELPQGSPTGPIRIDLTNFPCVIDVSEIVLRSTSNGLIVAEWKTCRELGTLRCGGHLRPIPKDEPVAFLSVGVDPQLYLPDLTALTAQPLILEVRSRVTRDVTSGLRALDHLIGNGRPADPSLAAAEAQARESYDHERALRLESERKIVDLTRQLEQQRAALASASAAAEAERRRRLEILSSGSWKITAPARSLYGALHRIFRSGRDDGRSH
jgi:hypothetical protein